MTNTTAPIEAAFELQRQSIEQSRQLVKQSLEFQQNSLETFLQNGISAQRSAQQQGTEFAQDLFNAQLEVFQSTLDAEKIKEAADQQFEQNAEQTQKLLNAQYEQGTALTQQLFDAFTSALDDEQFRATIENQFEAFNDLQTETWNEFESEFAASFEELSEQQKDLVEQSVDAFLDAQSNAEQRTIEGVQATQDTVEDVAAETIEAAE